MAIRVGTHPILRFYAGPTPTPADIYISAVLGAGGTLSNPEKAAIKTFYSDLETAGVYSKLHVMYPVLGGVSASNAINFVNPGTYDLTFTGTWAHSATGSFCASSNSNFANTGFNPSASASPSTNFSVGAMAQGASSNKYMGIGTSAANYIIMGDFGPTEFYYPGGPLNGAGNGFTGGGAFLMLNRTLSNSWKGGVIVSGSATGNWSFTSNQSSTYSSVYNGNWYFNGINGLSGFNSGGLLKFGYLASSMDNTQLQDLADAVNTLQTAFSRNIW
jgi:hypothetical protein